MIVFVEDDMSIRKLVTYALESNGYQVKAYGSGEEAFADNLGEAELFILDIMLPGMSGLDILERIRKDLVLKNVPVIMLTAKDSEYDVVYGLDSGADDYISKPFKILELLARVKAQVRRYRKEWKDDLVSGALRLSLSSRKVWVDGSEVVLTFKEYSLLEYLMARPGVAVTRETLLEKVWGYTYAGDTRTVDVHVCRIREKLGTEGNSLESVIGVGYRFRER